MSRTHQRYGIRRVLSDEQEDHHPDEIVYAIRRLLDAATEQTDHLDWTTFTVGIYREAGDTGPLVVDAEIEEVSP